MVHWLYRPHCTRNRCADNDRLHRRLSSAHSLFPATAQPKPAASSFCLCAVHVKNRREEGPTLLVMTPNVSGVGAASRPRTRHLESPRKNRSFRASPVLYTPSATTQCARVVASVCSQSRMIARTKLLSRASLICLVLRTRGAPSSYPCGSIGLSLQEYRQHEAHEDCDQGVEQEYAEEKDPCHCRNPVLVDDSPSRQVHAMR